MMRYLLGVAALILIFYLSFAFRQTINRMMAYLDLFIPLVSFVFVAGTLIDILNHTATDATWFVFVFASAGLITGLKMLWDDRRKNQRQLDKTQEQTLLEIARQQQGRITPIDIAMHSDYTVESAEQALNVFLEKGLCEKELTSTGKIVFVFAAFTPEQNPPSI